MIYDELLWGMFALGALSSGENPTFAAEKADAMLFQYKRRWNNKSYTDNKDIHDDTGSHRVTNNQ